MNRRGFLKGAAGLLSLPLVGKMASSVKSPMVREGIANVANVAQDVPIYFWKLVDKIKNLGKDVTETASTLDTQKVKQYKDYELTEDLTTGQIEIQRTGRQSDDAYVNEQASEDVFMTYRPSEKILLDEANPAGGVQKTMPEYEEFTAYVSNNRGNTGEILEEVSGVPDDIFLEVGEQIPEFLRKGKADGGIIDLAGGGNVLKGNLFPGGVGGPMRGRPPFMNPTMNTDGYGRMVNSITGELLSNFGKELPKEKSGGPMPMGLRRQNIINAMMQAKHSQETIDQTLGIMNLRNGGRVGMFKGGIFKGIKGIRGLDQKLLKQYKDEGMEFMDAVMKSTNDASSMRYEAKMKRLDELFKETNVFDEDYVDLLDAKISLEDPEFYKEFKNFPETLKNKSRSRIDPDWAEANFGEEYYDVLDRSRVSEINKSIDPNITERSMVDDIDDMNTANIDDFFGRKKNADGGRVGRWMGGSMSAGKSTLREMLRYFSKGSKHGKSGAEMLKMVNPKQISKYLENPNDLFMKGSSKEGIMATDMVKDYATKVEGERSMMIGELLDSAKNIRKGDKSINEYKEKIIKEMMDKGATREMAENLAEMVSGMAQKAGGRTPTPNITDQGLLELENIQKNLLTKGRSLNADGGRIELAKGGIPRALQLALKTIKSKYGDDIIKSGDEIESQSKLFDDFQTRNPDPTLNIPVQQEGKFTKAEYLIQRLENTIKGNPNDKYVQDTFPGFIDELKANPELAKNENVFKQLGGDLPEGQQIVVYGDDSVDFFTQKSGPGNIDRLKKLMEKHNISREKALKIMKMEPNDQVMELKMLEVANRKLNADGGIIGLTSNPRSASNKAGVETLFKRR